MRRSESPTADLPPEPLPLTVRQTARLWNCSPDVIYESIQRGDLPVPVLRIGRAIRLPRAAVFAAIGATEGEQEPGK